MSTRRVEYATLLRVRPSLGGCVHLAVERDTRGVPLCDADRFNYYPATPFPSISWILDGQLHMVEDSGGSVSTLGNPLPDVFFSGPTRTPQASWSPGAVQVLTVTFYPEALARLLDITIGHYVGSVLPLGKVLSGDILDQLTAVKFGRDPFGQIQNLLSILWSGEPAQQPSDVRSWLALLAAGAASTAGLTGRRSLQRLIKYWTGQSLRDLQLYARVENAISHGARMSKEERLNFAAVAAESGFSDQSHLGREVRRVTGLPPARLRELVESDEAFWMYRLLR